MKRRALFLASSALGLLAGCFGTEVSDYTGWAGDSYYDADGDGFDEYEDCDDTDPDVNPIAEEDCEDGVDNDCDDLIDGDDKEECG